MTLREPTIGDWDNTFDRTQVKHIDVWDVERDSIQNRIAATEHMAELLYADAWRINAEWQAAWDAEHAAPGDEPEPPAEAPPADQDPAPADPADQPTS